MLRPNHTVFRERWLSSLIEPSSPGQHNLVVGGLKRAARECEELGWCISSRYAGVITTEITQAGRNVLAEWIHPSITESSPSLTEQRAVAYLRRRGYTVQRNGQ